jgi:hypothetical protein
VRERIHRRPEDEQDRGATQSSQQQPQARNPSREMFAERERDRHADDPDERRKDRVRQRPTVPRRVAELRVCVALAAVVVHDDHERHDGAAERSSETSRCVAGIGSLRVKLPYGYLTAWRFRARLWSEIAG